MSNAQATAPQGVVIPKADQVKAVGGGKGYRFSKGRIITGRDEDGTLQVHPRLVGVVTRIGVHEGVTNDQYRKPYKQLECDMTTADGEIHVHVGLLDENRQLSPTQAALSFAWCLTQIQGPSDVIMFEASQGEAWVNEYGDKREPSTYVNLSRVDAEGLARRVYRPKADRSAPKRTSLEKWAELEAQLRAHPLFAARPAGDDRDDDGGDHGAAAPATHLQSLGQWARSKGWPTPEQAPAEYLKLHAVALKQDLRPTIAAVPDEHWQSIQAGCEQWLAARGTPPPLIQSAIDRLKPAQAAPDLAGFGASADYDPFAGSGQG